jgi:hypothetical protein
MMETGSNWIAGTCLIVLAAGGFAAHHEGASETVKNDAKPLSEPEKERSSEKAEEEGGSASPSNQNPCMEDIRQHCSDSFGTGDRGAVMQCVQDNYANFSERCQKAIQARMQDR